MSGVLFDLDGTLLDTLADIADSVNAALAENGLPPHPEQSYRRFVGDGVKNLIARATGGDEQRSAAVLAAYRREYALRLCDKTKPYRGILPTLRALRRKGVPCCVFSNKPHEDTLTLVARLFPRHSFAAVAGQKEGVPIKPDPTGALALCESLGLSPREILYVGDSGVDMQTARAAGMRPLGVSWGFRGREELLAFGAEALLNHPRELLMYM